MSELRFTEAFAIYGANLVNAQWAFSAIAEDGSLVLSCWQHKLTIPEKCILRYSDRLSRWQRVTPGKNLLCEHLSRAHDEQLPVRMVIATSKDPDAVDRGEEASGRQKSFHVREDFIGRVSPGFSRSSFFADHVGDL